VVSLYPRVPRTAGTAAGLTTRGRSTLWCAAILALTLTAGTLTACTTTDDISTADGDGQPSEVSGRIVVSAAASLADIFAELGEEFEAEHPGTTVVLNAAGSSTLAQQIIQGAPADVFAAASPATMAQVVDAGLAWDEATVLVRNRLVIAVPAGNPAGVVGLADLGDEDLTIALCAQEVPCGTASVRVFEAAGLTPAPDTYEQDVRAALTRVRLGEVDAALVYRTDVAAAGDAVDGIELAESEQGSTDYLLVRLTDAPNPRGAQAFIDYVLSDAGRAALGAAGFDLP
jgi:molybdate transport system substrate-binding protein